MSQKGLTMAGRSPRFPYFVVLMIIVLSPLVIASHAADESGVAPRDSQGRVLNLDFETGTLADWTATGQAFRGQPVQGDTVAARRSDMRSQHQGKFWIGTFERDGDQPEGSLTSVPFPVTHPFATFLVAGGSTEATRVEILRTDTNAIVFRTTGDETENLKPVLVDLREHQGKPIQIRLVDQHRGGWGHLNFDMFRFHQVAPKIPPRASATSLDTYAHEGLSPQEAAKAMTVPAGFKVTLFAGEPDVRQPIAFTIDERGRLWVAEAYSYPIRVPEAQARDRILIFEDRDGDGHFDDRKVFADKLNLVSGLAVGFGGVWVGSAPHLLFIPDANHDDRPDGPPRALLDGWGYQDTHETLNAFLWGPDGWLYGCHGVFTHSRVGKPGTPDQQRIPLNAGVWRYHPTRHTFEVFAHGTSNPWGIDFDDRGQAFLTACVIPHLYHVLPGGRYERQAGRHFNSATYDDIKTIADHRHYLGATPHSGNNRSDQAGGGHAHCGAMIYLGGAWPAEYRGRIFMNNIHGARINQDLLKPQGSGYVGSHAPDFLLANDRWSQIINFMTGPDGQVYFIDWYDRQQCHRNEVEIHDRSNGRIFKVTHGSPKSAQVDLRLRSDLELAALQLHENDWFVRQARRLLQERQPREETRAALEKIAFSNPDETRRLRGLWALNVHGGLTETQIQRALLDASSHVRGWTVRLACEQGTPSSEIFNAIVALAAKEQSPNTLLEVAAALQRLPLHQRWRILELLAAHGELARDQNLPLMIWYALEPLVETDAARAMRLAISGHIPSLINYTTRRVGAIGDAASLTALVEVLAETKPDEQRLEVLRALNQSLQGQRKVEMPESWPLLARQLLASPSAELRAQSLALALTLGDRSALAILRASLRNREEATQLRQQALDALLKQRDSELPGLLRELVNDTTLRKAAIRGLAAFDDPATPPFLLAKVDQFDSSEKRETYSALASRLSFARPLVNALEQGRIKPAELAADIVRQLRAFGDRGIDAQLSRSWGVIRSESGAASERIAAYRTMLRTKPPTEPDLMLGRAVFVKSCQQCHTLFGVGGKIGPDLTGSDRANLEYILSNILDPDALIGKDYIAQLISTTDGRVLTGLIREEDPRSITLATATETLVIPKSDIDERRVNEKSMMPADLWTTLKEPEIRGLVAYLASSGQVPLLVEDLNGVRLFNGRDLTGWSGDSKLWTVEDGAIVGRSPGLTQNAFLISETAYSDFRFSVSFQLKGGVGNSGVQFRSDPMPGGEIRGYQADLGAGWWGKLYEENGRGLLVDRADGATVVRPGEWNQYEIEAIGPVIELKLNGTVTARLEDAKGSPRGVIAFQLHSGGPMEVRFKDLKLESVVGAPPATGDVKPR